ncbi:DUF4114 domain-containing protein [Tenacibaculum jejuense]|uniref:DUF4114 domain-containing protein n=1 Tax=Tenacibaculum jejuense TaxID=584609 RepID=A0A238U678_9FLAO|nr:DUF4114 domain-containing protein [Tenacibaculum jejuense]SNR14545.1 Protein of unknown function precursor containing a C-terminal secretion signal [Tenacibaculum jejuense]
MKKLLLLFVFISQVTLAQNYKYLGSYSSNGTPHYLENPGDEVSTETMEMISNALPESYPVPEYNPQYITAGYDTNVELIQAAEVFVTFVAEGAGYRNVLGFYTYDLDNPPTSAPSEEDITIIFPNASALGSGGGLEVGDKVNIGSFPANTGIGWVLLANAWSSSQQRVGYGHWAVFSDPQFNPEADEELRHHNVLLSDSENERIILGFEDIRRDYGSCDNDFNDAIFYITATPFEAMRINNVADVNSANNVTSSYDGGLESNGKLAQLIAKRNLKRSKSKTYRNLKEFQPRFQKELLMSRGGTSIINYLPSTGMYGVETASVSSPDDLIGITNAKEVFAADYYDGNNRVSAILATKTEGTVYDHSKAICDRLNSSSVEDVRTVISRGHKMVSSKIKRANGLIEYTVGFSIKVGSVENELHSYWNIEQYPLGDYYNFQVWGSTYAQVFSNVNYILDTFSREKSLISNRDNTILPSVFVSSGKYANGKLFLNIINKEGVNEVVFNGNIQSTEIASVANYSEMLSLSGERKESLEIETGVLFDIGFSLKAPNSSAIDGLYLADGPWGLDYLDEYATVTNFDVQNEDVYDEEGTYEINRNIIVQGEVKGNINVFRHVLPGDQTLKVDSYNYISFEMKTTNTIEVVLMTEDLSDWNNRLRYVIPADSNQEIYNVPFSDFKDAEGNSREIEDVKTIVFSIMGDYQNTVSYDVSIKNLAFKENALTLSINDFDTTMNNSKLINYPNPFKTMTTIRLPKQANEVSLKVFDLLGREVYYKKIETKGIEKREVACSPNLTTKGVYKYIVVDDYGYKYKGTFISE